MHRAVISLGSNKGNRAACMRSAVRELQKLGGIEKISSIHQTKPWGFNADTDFLNQVVVLSTYLSPVQLLSALQKIEKDLGKDTHSPTRGYASRTMDLDILYFDDLNIESETLTIPHPRIREREFIIALLQEVGIAL
jgi:2-amino-4-hydroxy-6-hydroxymethyldihydropteridine diphosphokinase